MIREDNALQVSQINVGKRLDCHDLALQGAAERQAGVVCVQEPWVLWDWKTTRTHPQYDLALPLVTGSRLLVVTYVRRDLKATVVKVDDPKVVVVEVRGVKIWNVYRPPGCENWEWPRIGRTPTLVVGDFNLQHPAWQLGSTASEVATELEDWREKADLRHLVQDRPTHDKGNTLDLSLVSSSRDALAWVEESSSTGSDHFVVTTLVKRPVIRGKTDRVGLVVLPRRYNEWVELVNKLLSVPFPFEGTKDGVERSCEDLNECFKVAI